MEFNERIAAARRAAGLTQEQLGELVGVTRQAVSKWEAAQAVPDALTAGKLCEALHVSADYLLLGKEQPDGIAAPPPASALPDVCPCCGRDVSGTVCPVCGYHIPDSPPRGPRYAITSDYFGGFRDQEGAQQLVKYCGVTEGEAQGILDLLYTAHVSTPLRRGLDDRAALWVASHIDHGYFTMKIVEDCGEEDDILCAKPKAMELPAYTAGSGGGIGFWGVVGAVIVALIILSFL